MRALREVLAEAVQALSRAGVEGAVRDARLLLAAIIGLDVARLSLEPERPISQTQQTRFDAAVTARIAGKPVSRILAKRAFWGRDFKVAPEVLDPRPETEILIEAALAIGAPAQFVDLGCGSGIIAVTLLAEWPESLALATDIDAACLGVTRANARWHGVENRLATVQSDWFASITGPFDMIVSNPPYIRADEMASLAREVREYDPHLALSPGGDGLAAYREICAGVRDHLRPGGHVLVEIGPEQGAAVRRMMAQAGLESIRIQPDLDRRDRVVIGRKPV